MDKTELTSNKIDFYSILNNKTTHSTVMMKNIPMRISQKDLLQLLDSQGYSDVYDYLYLPMDLKTMCNRGYAYINFAHPVFILDFYLQFHGFQWRQFYKDCFSSKRCLVCYANVQGREANIDTIICKNIMKKAE